jgi:hypothetical protein
MATKAMTRESDGTMSSYLVAVDLIGKHRDLVPLCDVQNGHQVLLGVGTGIT